MSYLKNTTGQYLYFTMLSASDGSALTTGTVNGYRSIDGGAQAAVTGTISHKGNGQWQLALSQADTNGDEIGFFFTITGGIAVSVSIVTTTLTAALIALLSNLDAAISTRLASGSYTAPPSAAAVRSEIDSNSTQLAAILADTAVIGAAGAGLTAVPWNAAWDAEVQSEVADALAVYDPPTKTELDSAVAPLATATALATVDSIVTAILADTDTTIPALIAALNDISAAEVNAEIVDALATDTYAEPSGVPAATATLATKLGWLFMALRNQVTVTATKKTFFDDSGTAEWEKDLSDDGTTYTETEANSI
ncbi:MAG: hypothetical protein R3D55_11860 [Chloroflexota bacterium]